MHSAISEQGPVEQNCMIRENYLHCQVSGKDTIAKRVPLQRGHPSHARADNATINTCKMHNEMMMELLPATLNKIELLNVSVGPPRLI